jgi:hypothetical protein
MMRLRLHSEHQLARRPRVPFISAGLMRKEGIGSAKEALGKPPRGGKPRHHLLAGAFVSGHSEQSDPCRKVPTPIDHVHGTALRGCTGVLIAR